MKSSNRKNWIIYGAYGYTGELVVKEALLQGKRPILAGRNESKLEALSEKYGLPIRAFDLSSAKASLRGVGILINCAGPFDRTAEQLMDACLELGLHYFDITGEVEVFQAAYQRHDQAVKKGVILCPGVGFDIVPTDCLAALLKQALPDATHLELAFDFGTLPSMGTARTSIEAIGAGGLIREDGHLKQVGHGYRIRKIPFPHSSLWSVSLPWGDIFTSQISTGIPNAIVYGALPLPICLGMKLSNPFRRLLAQPKMQERLAALAEKFLGRGPDEETRAHASTRFWGCVTAKDGRHCSGTVSGPSVYVMTAETATAIAIESEAWEKGGGYFTASMLVGADFLSKRAGYQVNVSEVSQ